MKGLKRSRDPEDLASEDDEAGGVEIKRTRA